MAEAAKDTIFFYAELEGSSKLTHDEGTMHKVFSSLAESGLSETQVVSAISCMQNSGILFRERMV